MNDLSQRLSEEELPLVLEVFMIDTWPPGRGEAGGGATQTAGD